MRALLLGVSVLGATVASAASWSVSEAELATLVPTPGQIVLVAAAGEPQADAREVARALEQALQALGTAKLVMNDAALGSLAVATDEEVRRRAGTVPHQVLLIVRVFPQGKERVPTALVVATEPGGGAPRSITLAPIVALPPPPPPPKPVAAAAPPADPRQLEYEAKRLHFGQQSRIAGARTASFVYTHQAYAGTTPLTTTQLFERLGRDDFLAQTRARASLKLGLGLSGAGVAAVGLGLMVAAVASPCARVLYYSDGDCLERSGRGLLLPGAVTVGAGAVLGLVALLLPAYATSPDDVGRAVDESNAGLRRSLGLTSLRVEPQVSPEGGRLVMTGRF